MLGKKLEIDSGLFEIAFNVDVDYREPYPMTKYLNLVTGEILFIYDEDDAAACDGLDPIYNKKLKKIVHKNRQQYIKITGLSHGTEHEILKDFLASNWIEDESVKTIAQGCYFKSIGGWKNELKKRDDVDADFIICEWHRFHDQAVEGLKEKFLLDNNIDFKWR